MIDNRKRCSTIVSNLLQGAEDTQLQRVTPPPRAGSSDGEEGSEDEEGGRRRKPVPAGPPIDISVPLLPIPPKESLHLLRLTNIVGIEPRPFDAETFTSEEQTYIDEKGNQRVVLRDTNVIRWRVRRDGSGQEVMESNARFVRWPDGTQQLLLGDEVLDVAQQDISSNHFYLASAHKVCQLQAHLSSRLALKPPGLHSKLHKRLAAVVDQRNVKTNKVGMHAALTDPEREKQQMEDMARDREQLERQQGRRLARFAAARGAQQQQQRRLTSNFLEEDDDAYGEEADEDGDGLTATERARSALRRNRFDDAEEVSRRAATLVWGEGGR